MLIILSTLLTSCQDDDAEIIDTEKPSIDLTIAGAFPTSCDSIYFDEPFKVKVLLKDNMELGAFNIDIHHNFDQHTHSTEFEICDLDDVRTAVNAYTFVQDYSIPKGSTTYTTDATMTIPSSDGIDLYDQGDYHFQIRVTDEKGWSSMKGLNVKILHR